MISLIEQQSTYMSVKILIDASALISYPVSYIIIIRVNDCCFLDYIFKTVLLQGFLFDSNITAACSWDFNQ